MGRVGADQKGRWKNYAEANASEAGATPHLKTNGVDGSFAVDLRQLRLDRETKEIHQRKHLHRAAAVDLLSLARRHLFDLEVDDEGDGVLGM
jgi:hypothetical protein